MYQGKDANGAPGWISIDSRTKCNSVYELMEQRVYEIAAELYKCRNSGGEYNIIEERFGAYSTISQLAVSLQTIAEQQSSAEYIQLEILQKYASPVAAPDVQEPFYDEEDEATFWNGKKRAK